jgi:hypothetical protein
VTIAVTLVPSIWLGVDFFVAVPGAPETWVIRRRGRSSSSPPRT